VQYTHNAALYIHDESEIK